MEVSPKTVSNPVALLDPITQPLLSDVSREEQSTWTIKAEDDAEMSKNITCQ